MANASFKYKWVSNKADTSSDGYQTVTITNYKTNTVKNISTKIKVPANVEGTYYLKIIPINICDISSQCRSDVYVSGAYKINNKPTKPKINLNGYTSGSWTSKVVKITVSSTSGVGIDHYEYSNDNKNWSNDMNANATKWKRTFNSDKTSMSVELGWEVNLNFYIRAVDKNRNASDSSDVFNVKIDMTNPTCNISASPTTITSGSVVLTINGSDSRSGVKDYSWTSASSGFASTKTKTVSANGTYSAWVRDNAGKVGTCNYSVSNISKRPATPTIYNPSGGNWTNQSITLTVKTTTPASEIGYWYYSYDNANFVRYDNPSYNSYGLSTFNTSPYSAERNQPAYIRVCNKSASSATDTNNCSDSASTYIRIDRSMYTPALREIHNVSSYSCDWNNGYTTGTKYCYINISVYSMNSWWFETTDYDNGVGYQSWGAWFLGNNCSYIGGNPWGQWIWDSDGFFSVNGCSSEHYAIKNRDRLGNESSELQLHITILY